VTPRLAAVDDDRGDIVLGWLTKLMVTLSVLGLVGFDLIALGVNRVQAEDRAATAARAAASSPDAAKDVQQAYDAAVASLAEDESEHRVDPESFHVAEDGSVTVTVERTTTTLLVERVGPLRDWATATGTATARPVR
jgi:hypothetical protein